MQCKRSTTCDLSFKLGQMRLQIKQSIGSFERRMQSLHLVGLVLATAAAQTAYAADASLPVKAPPQQSQDKPYDWSGFYTGAHFGYAAGSSRWSAVLTGAAAPALTGSLDLFNGYDMFKGTGSYFAGFQGGYNYLLPSRLLIGVEADIAFPNTLSGAATFASPVTGTASYAEQVEMSGTLRGRIGYAPNLGTGHWLFYATGGLAWSLRSVHPHPDCRCARSAAWRRPAPWKICSWCRASAVPPASASSSR